ncbi:uncharacterized protein EAE97_001509 [Botrytis byssoidea]|uniref:Uncharacterized protein n=1 Tax=Botrytis byssoidea TaxID=139641 RepID=A0A9P5IW76_9HELO|nr:uncharacterized protein EAE97_001509 [Botrytis byssoidea]KAF7952012.1 hypothetical protein EAE97_001509 [Botrytis byssoidea]
MFRDSRHRLYSILTLALIFLALGTSLTGAKDSVIGIATPAITISSQAIEELGRDRPTVVYIYLTTFQTPLSQPTTQSTKHTISIKIKFLKHEEH